MISAQPNRAAQERLIAKAMQAPNQYVSFSHSLSISLSSLDRGSRELTLRFYAVGVNIVGQHHATSQSEFAELGQH